MQSADLQYQSRIKASCECKHCKNVHSTYITDMEIFRSFKLIINQSGR